MLRLSTLSGFAGLQVLREWAGVGYWSCAPSWGIAHTLADMVWTTVRPS